MNWKSNSLLNNNSKKKKSIWKTGYTHGKNKVRPVFISHCVQKSLQNESKTWVLYMRLKLLVEIVRETCWNICFSNYFWWDSKNTAIKSKNTQMGCHQTEASLHSKLNYHHNRDILQKGEKVFAELYIREGVNHHNG